MILTATKIFDKDLSSKGRDLPAVNLKRKKKDPAAKERAPRMDQRTHLLDEVKGKKQINKEEEPNLKKTVLKRGSFKEALPNLSQDNTEDQDMLQRNQTMNELDSWLASMNQGRQEWNDEFGTESAANWQSL